MKKQKIICMLANLFAQIPFEVWNKIIEEEPEWRQMNNFLEKYGFGRFAVLMISTGLNDFQLKGKAEITYWPKIRTLLEKSEVPNSLVEMEKMLAKFYRNERLAELKLRRLNTFLSSNLAKSLWIAKPEEVAKKFLQIWFKLSEVMNQRRDAKTISFAMKCLGIALLIAGQNNFSFERIPIPVDRRVRTFTERIGINVKDDEDVRTFWSRVLEELRKILPINMIHLDSLVWQIGTLSRPAIVNYFAKFDLKNIGEKVLEMVRE